MTYQAPVSDLLAMLAATAGPGRDLSELADGTAQSILAEAAAIAEGLLAPLDRVGDTVGLRFAEGVVTTPPGWAEAYRAWIAGGWNGVTAPEDAGGMGLPIAIGVACFEIWSGANLAFGLAPLLTSGAIEALHRHGSEELKRLYLPKLVSGEWTGTMNLTEPQAGSDLGALAAKAERHPDGSYRITGQKIYITYGDHDMTDNIVHLVLARLPDAPPGTRGISLFLVPKRLVDAEGRPGAPNDVRCAGLERKLGMHAAPTCTMVFGDAGGAVGFVVGEEHKGLACMFTMMNSARLAVGLQGVAAAEHATQKATAFARERRQGRTDPRSREMAAIIHHPDVARMLMTMKASTWAARAICYRTAAALDAARHAADPLARKAAGDRAALLTPIAKAFATDIANEVASLGIQVHGGMGFIEDTGAAQIQRDIRIAAIYEGTNGIQAIDLVTRKLPLEGGAVVAAEIAEMRGVVDRLRDVNTPALGRSCEALADALDTLERATAAIVGLLVARPAEALAGATPYLRLFGLTRGAASLAALALAAPAAEAPPTNVPAALTRFFCENLLPAVAGLEQSATRGGAALGEDGQSWMRAL